MLCGAVLRVLMTVILRPDGTSETHELLKEYGLPSSKGKLWDTENCTVKHPVVLMHSQSWQAWRAFQATCPHDKIQ